MVAFPKSKVRLITMRANNSNARSELNIYKFIFDEGCRLGVRNIIGWGDKFYQGHNILKIVDSTIVQVSSLYMFTRSS